MLARFTDFDPSFNVFDELRRRFDSVWDNYEGTSPDVGIYASSTWPKVNAYDAGHSLVLRADLPGVAEKDIHVTLVGDNLTISGERRTAAPEGYATQRQERPFAKFSRSWTLPYKVEAEKTTALLKDGVLTLTLAKAAEAQPRQISVRAQA